MKNYGKDQVSKHLKYFLKNLSDQISLKLNKKLFVIYFMLKRSDFPSFLPSAKKVFFMLFEMLVTFLMSIHTCEMKCDIPGKKREDFADPRKKGSHSHMVTGEVGTVKKLAYECLMRTGYQITTKKSLSKPLQSTNFFFFSSSPWMNEWMNK